MRIRSSNGVPSLFGGNGAFAMTLEQGMKTYHDQLSMLLPQFEGKWAMIDDVELLVCDSPEEANRIGFERCGKINDFLVVRIESDNPHCLG